HHPPAQRVPRFQARGRQRARALGAPRRLGLLLGGRRQEMSSFPLPQIANGARTWVIWVVPAAVLAALVGWELDWGRQVERAPAASQQVEPKPVTVAVLPEYRIEGGLPAHAETTERTLFNATRRPAPVLTGDNAPKRLKTGQFTLVGTTVTGERNIAFLK